MQVGIARPGDAAWLEFGASGAASCDHVHVWTFATERPNPWRDIVHRTAPLADGIVFKQDILAWPLLRLVKQP